MRTIFIFTVFTFPFKSIIDQEMVVKLAKWAASTSNTFGPIQHVNVQLMPTSVFLLNKKLLLFIFLALQDLKREGKVRNNNDLSLATQYFWYIQENTVIYCEQKVLSKSTLGYNMTTQVVGGFLGLNFLHFTRIYTVAHPSGQNKTQNLVIYNR